ncbi:MAG: hypothetical protein U0790_16025 [Isosphaeraceae bacterium]
MKRTTDRAAARERLGGNGSRSTGILVRSCGCAFALLLAAGSLPGCSNADQGATAVYPVKGKVTFEGEPASGAFVVFHPKSAAAPGGEGQRPSAQVKPDGSFEVTTRSQADGAPAGDYAVTVQWNKLVKQGSDATPGPNVIPPDYTKPDTTPIKVSVKQSSNELNPFEITRKK